MADSADARRRWFGLLFLTLAAGMLIWGQTLLRPWLKGWMFVIYWLVCFILTTLAILTAILDMRATRRRTRAEQHELLERTWKDLRHRPEDWDRLK